MAGLRNREVSPLAFHAVLPIVDVFMSIDDVRFRRPVVPGDRLELHVEKIQSRANVWKFSGKGIVEGKVAAEATFAAMIR